MFSQSDNRPYVFVRGRLGATTRAISSSLSSSYLAEESCEFPIYTFVAIQLGLILLLQFIVPIVDIISEGPKAKRQPPSVVGTLFILQLMWLCLGVMWHGSDSDCEESAPYLTYACQWLVLVYMCVVPFEFLWWARLICGSIQDEAKGAKAIN